MNFQRESLYTKMYIHIPGNLVYIKFVTRIFSFRSFMEWQYIFFLQRDSAGKSETSMDIKID